MSTTSYLERFNYQLAGPEQGRKWIFLHGLMGYGSNWRKIISQMPTERTLTFDQRGHGRSWKPLTGYSSEDYADDLFLIAQELGWSNFILVGHSMGGRNALSFAHKYPELVSKLVIEDIGPDSSPKAFDDYQNLLKSVPTPFKSKLAAKEFFLNQWPKLGVVHENAITLGQYLYSNLEDKSGDQVDWRFSKEAILASVELGRVKNAWKELSDLMIPALIIRGENSKELSKDVFKKMLAINSMLSGIEITNAGHWVHAEKSKDFVQAILEFANR